MFVFKLIIFIVVLIFLLPWILSIVSLIMVHRRGGNVKESIRKNLSYPQDDQPLEKSWCDEVAKYERQMQENRPFVDQGFDGMSFDRMSFSNMGFGGSESCKKSD